jgi:hypothetical protein
VGLVSRYHNILRAMLDSEVSGTRADGESSRPGPYRGMYDLDNLVKTLMAPSLRGTVQPMRSYRSTMGEILEFRRSPAKQAQLSAKQRMMGLPPQPVTRDMLLECQSFSGVATTPSCDGCLEPGPISRSDPALPRAAPFLRLAWCAT